MTKKDTLDGVKKDDPEQSRRFVETAERLDVDKSSNSFEAKMKAIAKNKIRDRGKKTKIPD